MVFDFISGWEKDLNGLKRVQAGKLDLFRNDDGRGGWTEKPKTFLIDSMQIDSGDAMTDDFRQAAAQEIAEFKTEYMRRFPGRDADSVTTEDLLREVLNTIGKAGKLGEGIRCVVSVSMLTEGWDANTVTHILGVRAFGTQLLCEQVVGRALRRMSYSLTPETADLAPADQRFGPEYAEVYGIPFSFIPSAGTVKEPIEGPLPTRVRSLPDREALAMTFPRLLGYRFHLPERRLISAFTQDSVLRLTTASIPSEVEMRAMVGKSEYHTLNALKDARPNHVAFELAKCALERFLRDENDEQQPWLFPQVLDITREWIATCLQLGENAFMQLLLFGRNKSLAIERIYHGIINGSNVGAKRVLPILQPYDTLGSTRHVDFFTARPTFATGATRSHISHVVADTDVWEQNVAYKLERMTEVLRYAKNDHLGFTIPYTFENREKQYIPDFLVAIDDGQGDADPLNLIVEVSGERDEMKAQKTATARTQWIPAVNNHGTFGRWSFLEITDPSNLQTEVRAHVASLQSKTETVHAA